MGDVVEFKPINIYIEEIVEFCGSRNGSVTFTIKKDDDGVDKWFGLVSYSINGEEPVKHIMAHENFNKLVIGLKRII